jgi:non-heme chloroperoxidase
MSTIKTQEGTEIFFKDWGQGQPIVFSHGWPLSADDLDTQMMFFLGNGFRVIAHDRRGHGRSTQTGGGHDMDHYADDLAALTAPSSPPVFEKIPSQVSIPRTQTSEL